MSNSIFLDKTTIPKDKDVQKVLNESMKNWNALRDFMSGNHDNVSEEWIFPGRTTAGLCGLKLKNETLST